MSGKSLKLAKSLLAAAVASTLLVTVCSAKGNGEASAATKGGKAAASTKKDEMTIKSKEGDIQLTVGSDWIKDLKLNTGGRLFAINPSKDQYVIVTSISKTDIADKATLEDMKELFIANTELMSKNFKEIETKDIKFTGFLRNKLNLPLKSTILKHIAWSSCLVKETRSTKSLRTPRNRNLPIIKKCY